MPSQPPRSSPRHQGRPLPVTVAGVVVSAVLLVTGGCGGDPQPSASAPAAASPTQVTPTTGAASTPAPTSTPTTGPTDGTATDEGDTAPADSADLCRDLVAATEGRADAGALSEVSGLAASQTDPGLLWAHNDSGHDVVLHALDRTGAQRGSVEVEVDGRDIEDMALVDGVIYLADIGDNDREREEVAVHRFPEPDPATSTVPADQVETIRLRYPDRARDAEALAVDPIQDLLVIITKEVAIGTSGDSLVGAASTPVFTAPLPPPGEAATAAVELTRAGTVPLDELDPLATGSGPTEGPVAVYGGAGVATGVDIRADGAAIAVRTYETVWLFPRSPLVSVAEALEGEPCEAPTVAEPQGEAVAFLDPSRSDFATMSEQDPALNVTSRP